MQHKTFWIFFLFGALLGLLVGVMKTDIVLWLVVGSVLGVLVAVFFEYTPAKREPEKALVVGFLLLLPIILFDEYLEGRFWYDVFGILAVIGSFSVIVNFVKMLRTSKTK